MSDFYEIDFLPVHRADSGDAIVIRFQIGQQWSLHVIDGGYDSTAVSLAQHIERTYATRLINRVVVTHPDQDHAEGLAPILRQFTVSELWMLRPWSYARELLPHFARYSSVDALEKRLRDDYPYIAELERIAFHKHIPILEPFQGARIGPFVVLAPSPRRYLELILESERTPQRSVRSRTMPPGLLSPFFSAAVRFVKAGWGSEKFSPEETSIENEMSVVQYGALCGHKILLTGDAGRNAMTEAADFAPHAGLALPGIDRFQAPHHGGRRNLSTAILDRWVGPRLAQAVAPGYERFTAMISAAKEDAEHPRKAVLRALIHRGAFIATTENAGFRIPGGAAPDRGWGSMKPAAYPDEQED
jgi:beta-lactamase superfamily II metal-dependent hydrolase